MLAEPLSKATGWLRDGWRPRPKSLPTMYDLPYESPEDGMPDLFHSIQPQLLSETFCPPTYPIGQVFVAADLYLYYDLQHPAWYKRPDWFTVLGVPRATELHELRFSYLIWQEKVAPYLIVELLSPGTEQEDLGETVPVRDQPPIKREVYEQRLKVPYYLVYSRHTLELRAFRWVKGRYREVKVTDQGLWLPQAQLGIGVWSGTYQLTHGSWLRFYDAQGRWISTKDEQIAAKDEQIAAEAQARLLAEQQVRALAAELAQMKAEI